MYEGGTKINTNTFSVQYVSNESDEWILLLMSNNKDDHVKYRTHHLYQIQSLMVKEGRYKQVEVVRTTFIRCKLCKIHQLKNICHFSEIHTGFLPFSAFSMEDHYETMMNNQSSHS
jgi:hypothetical protein